VAGRRAGQLIRQSFSFRAGKRGTTKLLRSVHGTPTPRLPTPRLHEYIPCGHGAHSRELRHRPLCSSRPYVCEVVLGGCIRVRNQREERLREEVGGGRSHQRRQHQRRPTHHANALTTGRQTHDKPTSIHTKTTYILGYIHTYVRTYTLTTTHLRPTNAN